MLKVIGEIFRPEPKVLYIEPYFGCNYKCIFCIHGSGYEIKTAELWPHLFEKLKPLIEKVMHVHITGLGEPFLNPHLLDYLAYFRQKEKSFYINSNGLLVENAHIDLMTTSKSELSVSLDAGDPETYGLVRRNGNWDGVISILKKISRIRADRKSHYPLIYISYHINSLNLMSLRKIPGLARELGVDAVKLSWTMLPRKHGAYTIFDDMEKARDIIDGVCKELGRAGIRIANEASLCERVRKCWNFSQICFVAASGAVAACCTRWLTIGNIDDNRFEDIWNGMPRRRLGLAILNGTPDGACTSCPQALGADYGKNKEDFLNPEGLDTLIVTEKEKSISRLPSLEGLEDSFRLGVSTLLEGNYGGAIDIFSSLEKRFPDFFEIKNNLAVACFYHGNVERCRETLDSALGIPHNEQLIQSNLDVLRRSG